MEGFKIYQSEDGGLSLDVAVKNDSVRLTQKQLLDLLGRDKSTISRHLNKVFSEGELEKDSVVAKYATTGSDGKNS